MKEAANRGDLTSLRDLFKKTAGHAFEYLASWMIEGLGQPHRWFESAAPAPPTDWSI
jgi:hypothetical protein